MDYKNASKTSRTDKERRKAPDLRLRPETQAIPKSELSAWLVTTKKVYGNNAVTTSSIYQLHKTNPTIEEVKKIVEEEGAILFMKELAE